MEIKYMCSKNCIRFGTSNLIGGEVEGKSVIEVGSYDINGSLRSYIKSQKPSEYIGVDVTTGPGVDMVCSGEDLLKKFGTERFDIVISTEVLEHVRDWRLVISNLKNLCKSNGIILITTRSKGFKYHGYPYDFWRYEQDDMKDIFSDCEILVLEKDPQNGVFIKVRKPSNFIENDLSRIKLYNIVANRRVESLDEKYFKTLRYKSFIISVIREDAYKIALSIINKFPHHD